MRTLVLAAAAALAACGTLPPREAARKAFRDRYDGKVTAYSTETVKSLAAWSEDPDPEVRWRAVYAFSRWPEPRAEAALRRAQSDADWRARLFAARGLAKLKLAPDAALLADPDLRVRAEAIAGFGAAELSRRLPASVFADPSAHARAAAADAAAASNDRDRVPLLRKMAESDGPLARGRALLALAKLAGVAEAATLERGRRDPHWWIRARAVEASAALPDGGAILRAALADPDPRVASAALETLAASTASFSAAELGAALEGATELEVIGTAADAAGARPSEELVEPLFSVLRRSGAGVPAEIRDGLRAALKKHAEAFPGRRASILAGLAAQPAPRDPPRVFPRLSGPKTVVMETARGTFEIELDPAAAPNTAAAFADSVERKLYDGLTWHRVVTNFVVQGGDPRGSGWGDAGWRLADEWGKTPFDRGTVGLPRAEKDTGGCQLFVSVVPTPHLDGRYTVFGRVTKGLEVLDLLEPGDAIVSARLR